MYASAPIDVHARKQNDPVSFVWRSKKEDT